MKIGIERRLETYKQAQKQEDVAYAAKKKAMEEIAERMHDKYSAEITEHPEVFAAGFEAEPDVESSRIRLKLEVEPSKPWEEIEAEFTEWRRNLKPDIKEIIEEDIEFHIRYDWFGDHKSEEE